MIYKLLALLATVSSVGTSQDGLPDRLVQALNTKNEASLTQLVKDDFTDESPAALRVSRLLDFAQQGAPFRLISVDKASDTELVVHIIDSHGTRLLVDLAITSDPPQKIRSLTARPEGSYDPNSPAIVNYRSLDDLAAQVIAKDGSPGMGIAVMKDGKMSTGFAGVCEVGKSEKPAPNVSWSIGSIGKPICSTIVGLLIEQGKLDWNSTLGELLPDIKMRDEYKGATVEQLMQHRAGVQGDPGVTRAMIQRIVGDATTGTEIRARYAADILSREPLGKPGSVYQYSNAGYALLSVIAERVTHKPYEQLLHDMVFTPLKLHHSYSAVDVHPSGDPSGHIRGPQGLQPVNMGGKIEYMFAGAGGGIYMSVEDLATFGEEHLKGLNGVDSLLKAATVKRLHTAGTTQSPSFQYACGWGIESAPGQVPFHGHNGSNGTMRAQLCIFPKLGLVVAAMANAGGEENENPGLVAAMAIAKRYSPSQLVGNNAVRH